MNNTNNVGTFVISLDFELKWGGIFNSKSVCNGFDKRVPYVEKIIPEILNIFNKYSIHATWATVGAIACKTKEEAIKILNQGENCSYIDKVNDYFENIIEEEYYFRPDLIQQISDTENQELASHTFSHYYVFENNDFNALKNEMYFSNKCIGKFAGKNLHTVVFPKNQFDINCVNIINNQGFDIVRGNQKFKRFSSSSKTHKLLRFIDAYFPLCGKSSYSKKEVFHDGIYDVRASRFFRTYEKKLSIFEFLKIIRIKSEMKKAAKSGEIYHIWFHPHNLATSMDKNLITLEEIAKYYTYLNKKFGMKSQNMNECVLEIRGI